ncbi:MAG: GntR family transcriptional regulator [Methylobacteriaceae bacterium]|nr:GntR family transcriptional regulator [Methylobacteriaceae bacterium]
MKVLSQLARGEPQEGASLREDAYRRLGDLLASGRLQPGDKVSLRVVAEALGVSIMPVREAVSRLVAAAALEVTPNRAIRVPMMTGGQFRELTALRVAIEGHAAAEAARRRDERALAAIREAELRFRNHSLTRKPDQQRAVELNKEFHFAVYAAAGSPMLEDVIRALWLKAGPMINLSVRDNPAGLTSGGVPIHARIVEAIAARQPEQARAALGRDIETAAEFILARCEMREDAAAAHLPEILPARTARRRA